MAIEKKWPTVPPRLLTADGDAEGNIQIASTSGFKVKQIVVLQAPALPPLTVKVQRVTSSTQMIVGPATPPVQGKQNMNTRIDVSAYTVLAGSFIFAAEQDKSTLKPDDIIQAVYRQEPGTTIGVELDDEFGDPYNEGNPIPVTIISGSGGGGLVPSNYDDVKIVKNSNGDPTQYQFYLAGVSVGNINVFYDTFGASEYKKA